jgi:hypothetical protein
MYLCNIPSKLEQKGVPPRIAYTLAKGPELRAQEFHHSSIAHRRVAASSLETWM